MQFEPFPKMARLSRPCVITEKLDGTNAQIVISKALDPAGPIHLGVWGDDEWVINAGSRTRFITEKDDNFGFAKWVAANGEELLKLGEGTHFGEWWGSGIQRNYGLKEKRFSLFNTARWHKEEDRPACCGVVPILYQGEFDTEQVRVQLNNLRNFGSVAVPGYMDPEGVVIWHEHARVMFKKTLVNDEAGKGQ